MIIPPNRRRLPSRYIESSGGNAARPRRVPWLADRGESSCGETIVGELKLLLTLLQYNQKRSLVYITPRVSCGEAWRGPGFFRASAQARRIESQGRDRSRRLLHPVVIQKDCNTDLPRVHGIVQARGE